MATYTPGGISVPFAKHGLYRVITFGRSYAVWIDTDDVAHQSVSPLDWDLKNAKDGSGDFGKAVFRRGATYTITAEEETILSAAIAAETIGGTVG